MLTKKMIAVVSAVLLSTACGPTPSDPSSPADPSSETPPTTHTCIHPTHCDEVIDPGLVMTDVAAANCYGFEGDPVGIYTTDGCDPSWIGSTMPPGALPIWLSTANVTSPSAVWTRFTPPDAVTP